MQFKRISRRPIKVGLVIALLGIAGSIFLIMRNYPGTMELPNAFLNAHMVSLYLQPAVLVLLYSQILTFRRVNLLVGVRQKTRWMTVRLLGLATGYCMVVFLGLFGPYFLTDYPLFKYGNPTIGTALLVLHVAVFLVLSWLLVGAYELPHPHVLLLIALVMDLAYHYYLEKSLLINYSTMYDEVYRTIHHIYGGF